MFLRSLNSRLARDCVSLNACSFIVGLLQGRPACSKSSSSSQAVLLVEAFFQKAGTFGYLALWAGLSPGAVVAWDVKCWLCRHVSLLKDAKAYWLMAGALCRISDGAVAELQLLAQSDLQDPALGVDVGTTGGLVKRVLQAVAGLMKPLKETEPAQSAPASTPSQQAAASAPGKSQKDQVLCTCLHLLLCQCSNALSAQVCFQHLQSVDMHVVCGIPRPETAMGR